MNHLILLRHGESMWNQANLFTGWVDVPLSVNGIQEAIEAGEKIKHIRIDVIFTSFLVRALTTALLAMSRHDPGKYPVIMHDEENMKKWGMIHNTAILEKIIPVHRCWELNERMYGMLQGYNKAEMAELYGEEQVRMWRRSFDAPPPEGESLEMTAQRSIPYFNHTILPQLREGKNILISAHGNSLRSLVMHLEDLTSEEILKLEIPTGTPIIYTFDQESFTKL
ncbi:MAG: 2,3-bisphosphoglycerate-dependent phosphoglycerate mutase [Chlamydiales bacterium]